MVNLLKKKLFLGFAIIALVLMGTFCIAKSVFAYVHTSTLQLGSSGSQVVSLQKALGVNPASGEFDYATRAAVVTFQLNHGFVADGVVGPATGKAIQVSSTQTVLAPSQNPISNSTSTPVSSPYPAGCTSSTKFSATTGKPCKTDLLPGCTSSTDYYEYSTITDEPCVNVNLYQAGCNSTFGYSITTGISCEIPVGCTSVKGYSATTGRPCSDTSPALPLPDGCTSRNGYSPIDGASCSTGLYNSPLSGDAGSLVNAVRVSGFANRGIAENVSNSWFAGYDLTADQGSDLAVSSLKLTLRFVSGSGSNKLNKYAESIHIWQDGTEVGSADVSSFSRNNNVYTKTINTSGATISADGESEFFFGLDTLENIDSSDKDNLWAVALTEVRYRDASGANVTDASTGSIGSDGESQFYFVPIDNNDDY